MSSAPGNRFRQRAMRRDTLQSVALVAATLSAGAADAAIVYSGTLNLQQSVGGKGSNGFAVNLPDDQQLRFLFSGPAGAQTSIAIIGLNDGSVAVPTFVGDDNTLVQLAAGSLLDPTGSFTAGPLRVIGGKSGGKSPGGVVVPDWTVGTTAYFGFRFTANGSDLVGWGRFSVTDPLDNSVLVDYAYEDSGGTLRVGQTTAAVPEPGMAGLVLAGLLAAAATGRRRQPQAGATAA